MAYTSNRRDRRFFDVYIMRVEDTQPRLILEQDGNNFVLDWSADGRSLLCMIADGPFDHHIYLVSVEKGKVTPLAPHEGSTIFSPAHISKTDGSIYLVTDLGRGKPQLARIKPGESNLSF